MHEKTMMMPDETELQTFPLIWRFTDAQKYTQLSCDEFQRFQPLPEAESLQAWERYVYPASGPGKRHLMQLLVQRHIAWPDVPSFLSKSKEETEGVVQTLRREIPAEVSSEVLFFWHAEVCVRTDWRLFLDHWDDFCYPSDDSNLVVLPEMEKVVAYIEDRWHIFNRVKSNTVFALNEND